MYEIIRRPTELHLGLETMTNKMQSYSNIPRGEKPPRSYGQVYNATATEAYKADQLHL